MSCKKIWQKKNEEPPCDTCIEPLMEENVDAVKVYFPVQNQLIISPSGQVVDISIPAIKIMMDLYEVRDQKRCMEKVIELFNYFRKESKGM